MTITAPTGLAIAVVVAPLIILTALRINAALVFLSLCLGEVLVMFAGKEATETVGILNSHGDANANLVSLGLLLIPVVLTAFIMIGTVKGKLKLAFNGLPALAVGTLGLLLAEPLFTPGLQGGIENTVVWQQIQGLQMVAITASALISLLAWWMQRPKHKHHDEDGKGKKHK